MGAGAGADPGDAVDSCDTACYVAALPTTRIHVTDAIEGNLSTACLLSPRLER